MRVFELVKAGGWVMVPLILCSIAALAIIGERLWTLRKKFVIPPTLLARSSNGWSGASWAAISCSNYAIARPWGAYWQRA